MAERSSRKAHLLVKQQLFAAREYWRNDNARYGRLLNECLFLQHYLRDDALTKSRNRIQPKSLKQFNLTRHKASLLLRAMPDFDTHAVQPNASAAAAEVSARIIKNIFYDPLKAYHDARSRMVWSMLAAERGNIAIEWHPKWGVCFRGMDPRRGHLTPGFTFLHDPRNPRFMEEVPMRMSELVKMKSAGWNIPRDLSGDGGLLDYDESGDRQADGITRDQANRDPQNAINEQDDPIVTVCKSWYRDDPFGADNKRFADSDLPEDEWVFIDDMTRQTVPFDPMNPQPPVGPSGQPMRLATSKAELNMDHEYGSGVLIITAPFYSGEDTLFEGSWTEGALYPDATLAALPYMELTSYKHPLRRVGISDTELTHSLLVVDNATFRHAYEQNNATTSLLVTMKGALRDSQNNQYQFKNLPTDIAFADNVMAMEATKLLQTAGMSPSFPPFMGMIDQKWQDIGTGDMASQLGPERSKDIAVGTFNGLQQSGDLPVQLHQQDLNLQESIGARVALDWCRAYMGDQVVSWVTDDGDVVHANVRGSDLVPLHVTILASKEFRQQDIDRMQAQAQALGQLGSLPLPPPILMAVIPAMLKEAGFSPDVVNAFRDAMAQQPQPGAANGPPQGQPNLSVVQGGSPQ